MVPHDQMKPRVEHDCLTGHHGIPADSDDRNGNPVVGGDLEKLEQEAKCVQNAAITGDDEGPKVETSMPLECKEDLDVQLDDIVPCHGREGGNGHDSWNVLCDLIPSGTVRVWRG